MAYSFEQIFAADPANPANVAANAAVTIFAPGDATMTPLAITDPDGTPLPNPIPVNANGFGSAFAHATLDRVAWAGGGFTGFFTSYEGMKQEAVAARTAAEFAAANAAAEAQVAIGTATVAATAAASDAEAAATAAANSAALVGAPADSAIAAAINGSATETKTALNATFALKSELASAGLKVVYHLGDASVARPATTSAVMWIGWVAPLNMVNGDLYMEATEQEPVIAWHTAYSASAITTLADGALVASLPDTSGNGRNAVQATSTKQPKWYGGALPYVRFDGVDDFLQTTAFASPLAQPGTLVLVAKLATVTTASSPTKEMVNGRTTAAEWSISQRGVSGNAGSEVWQSGAGTRRNGPATDKPTAGQWFIFTFVVNGATSYLRVNGSQTANADYGANSLDGLTLGSLYNGLGGFSDMDLAELRLAPTALAGAKVAELESYFAGKYGITL